ncbi:hypothetical protein GCM10007160_01450 [Litchfieldella qijiaojingensis]|uniref:Negative regulator of flagellin synthesis n=1 Tax=Litchfieldella qijiaojingensis TaxID=980347 RepID=A0ABQ2YCP8_9GAMM|nr:flagellar biosynthesis anti-sigma factor FlgM [Halomonas qijiaojingensis]GGX77932.1 hypothetical protein GCM10007160_01450 [Halomonas qijiaojingensis]
MKIDSSHPLTRPTQSESGNKATKADLNTPSTQQEGAPAAITHLSQSTGDSGQDIDLARVEEIRQAISEGRLEIRAERIADGLIDSVRDLLGTTSGDRGNS